MDGEGHVAFDAGDAGVGGTVHHVPLFHGGTAAVTVVGDPSLVPLVTVHDVGLNHRLCFQSVSLCCAELLLGNFCLYHVDVPGLEPDAPPVDQDAPLTAWTVDSLAEVVLRVAEYFNLREALGLGAGLGALALAAAAAQGGEESRFCGIVLVSPPALRAGWWEWGFTTAACQTLARQGWTDWAANHVVQRLFSPVARGGERGSDLLHSYKKELKTQDPKAVASHLQALLRRPDAVASIAPKLKCHTLVISGEKGLYHKEALELNAALDKRLSAWVEVDGGGALLTEERPTVLLSPLQLFVRRLQQEGLLQGVRSGLVPR